MSKERQIARAQREAEAAERAEAERVRRERETAARAKRERRALWWRRLRLWSNDQRRRDTRERVTALILFVTVVIVLAYLLTRSVSATVGTALIAVIASPVLVMLFFERRR